MPSDIVEASHGILGKVLAYLVLSRTERQEFERLAPVPKRQHEWLMGRCAAKDAVRRLLRRHNGFDPAYADIEIAAGADGQPVVTGYVTRQIGKVPAVSISHSAGTAAAVATLDGDAIGLDIEHVSSLSPEIEDNAFSPAERETLAGLTGSLRKEWLLRMWCARESVAKALGDGLRHGLASIAVIGVQMTAGAVTLKLANGLATLYPHLAAERMDVQTSRDGDWICAATNPVHLPQPRNKESL
jgi:phosphopantetheine--protein transferase-like protein